MQQDCERHELGMIKKFIEEVNQLEYEKALLSGRLRMRFMESLYEGIQR